MRKKIPAIILFTLIVMFSLKLCAETLVPEYSVLNEKVTDTAFRAQIILEVLVTGRVTEEGLRDLLNELYASLKERKGFKYYTSPSHVYIFAYMSREHQIAGVGQWIAMLEMTPSSRRPYINMDRRQLDQIGIEPQSRSGLSEIERRKIWRELVKAEDKSSREAEKNCPLPNQYDPEFNKTLWESKIQEQIELQEKLYEKYQDEITRKFAITREQLMDIAAEGEEKSWPLVK
jgi:hypothetical protein